MRLSFCGGEIGDKCKTWVAQASKGNAASKMHSTCPLAPKLDSRRSVVAVGLKAASTFTDSTPCTNVPLKCIFCTPEVWVWKNSMFHHVEQQHTSALDLSKSDPNTVRFEESYNVGKVETDAVAEKLRKCKGRGKGRSARAPAPSRTVAPRKKSVPAPIARTEISQQKGGSGDLDESHGSEEGGSGEEEDSDEEDSDDGGTPRMGMWMRERKERGRRRRKNERRKNKRRKRTSAREGVFGRGRGDLTLLMAKQRKGVSTYTNIRCCTWRS